MDIPQSISNILGQSTAPVAVADSVKSLAFVGNIYVLLGAIILIVLAIAVVVLLKRIIENSVLGLIVWAVAKFVFGINLPFWTSLIVSAIFGLAGIGALLLLRFLGVY
jgi:hypothetical protein